MFDFCTCNWHRLCVTYVMSVFSKANSILNETHTLKSKFQYLLVLFLVYFKMLTAFLAISVFVSLLMNGAFDTANNNRVKNPN